MDDKRIAMVAIVVEDTESVRQMNEILHDYGQYIIGRMGIPYRQKNISLISVAMDAPNDVINAFTGKLGNLNGVNVKTAFSKIV